jgi:hypothetical protein
MVGFMQSFLFMISRFLAIFQERRMASLSVGPYQDRPFISTRQTAVDSFLMKHEPLNELLKSNATWWLLDFVQKKMHGVA